MTYDDDPVLIEGYKDIGRSEVMAMAIAFTRGKRVVGTRKLLAELGVESGPDRDALLSVLDRDAMAAELALHHTTQTDYGIGCSCGLWLNGDPARDFWGHVVDAMLREG